MALTCVKEMGLMDLWSDSLGMAYTDSKIHGIGRAKQAIFAVSDHYAWDTNGNVLNHYTTPMSARSESVISTLGGKITVIGGTTTQDIWQFNPAGGYSSGSWTQITADYTPSIGSRLMAWGADVGSTFYIGGGWNNNTVYKTTNFTSWTLVGNLPANIGKISACGCCVFGGKIYIIGGAKVLGTTTTDLYHGDVPGYVYQLDPATDTWTLISQNQQRFGQIWCDAVATSTHIYVNKGYIDPYAISNWYSPVGSAVSGNNRGFMRSTDGVNWTDLSTYDGNAFFFERHRTGAVNVGGTPYFVGGYGANDMWKYV